MIKRCPICKGEHLTIKTDGTIEEYPNIVFTVKCHSCLFSWQMNAPKQQAELDEIINSL